MPEATQYTTDTSGKAWQAIEQAHIDEATKRNAMIETAWQYYDGDHALPLKIQKDGYDDNVIVNHVVTLAEKLAGFLIGDGVAFEAGSDDDQTSETANDDIKRLWEANRGDILQNDIALAGAVEGHNAVRIMPSTDAQGEIVTDGVPRLVRIKQKHFAAFWDAFDMQRVLWYRLQSAAGGMGRRIDYVRGLVAEDGTVDHDQPIWTEVVWKLSHLGAVQSPFGAADRWERESVKIWEYPWAPVVDWKNLPCPNEYYGKNDVNGAIKLNKALNFILSNTMRIVKHHAHPKTIGIGMDAAEIVPTVVGGLWTVNKPAGEANIYNLEMASDGALSQWLAGVIAESLWQSGGVVDPQTIKDKVGALTNFGLHVLYTDAIRKTDKKRLLYGEAFELINKYALEVAGRPVPATVATVWDSVLPRDEDKEAETLLNEQGAGLISKETYRDRRGYSNDQEEERIAGERQSTANPLAGLLSGNGFDSIGFNRGAG